MTIEDMSILFSYLLVNVGECFIGASLRYPNLLGQSNTKSRLFGFSIMQPNSPLHALGR